METHINTVKLMIYGLINIAKKVGKYFQKTFMSHAKINLEIELKIEIRVTLSIELRNHLSNIHESYINNNLIFRYQVMSFCLNNTFTNISIEITQ